MKKTILLGMLACFFFTSSVNAQAIEKGTVLVDAYYGFPNLYKAVFSAANSNGSELNLNEGGAGPLGIRGEYLLTDKIGIGLDLGFSNAFVNYDRNSFVIDPDTGEGSDVVYTDEFKTRRIGGIVTFNVHFLKSDNVDFYAMVGAGYKNRKSISDSTDPIFEPTEFESLSPVAFRVGTGLRYFFTDNVGINVALGLGHGSLLNGGVSFKF